MFEFYAPACDNPAGNFLNLELHDGTSYLGIFGQVSVQSGPVFATRRFTPAAGTRTYVVRQWNSGNFPYGVKAGAGGSGTLAPGYIRITKA